MGWRSRRSRRMSWRRVRCGCGARKLSPLFTGMNFLIALLAQRLGASRHLVEAEPRERRREGALGFCKGRLDNFIQDARAVFQLIVLDRAGRTQDIGDADALALACKLVAAAWTAQSLKDAFVHQRLQHRLEVARRKIVARCKLARRDRPRARV